MNQSLQCKLHITNQCTPQEFKEASLYDEIKHDSEQIRDQRYRAKVLKSTSSSSNDSLKECIKK